MPQSNNITLRIIAPPSLAQVVNAYKVLVLHSIQGATRQVLKKESNFEEPTVEFVDGNERVVLKLLAVKSGNRFEQLCNWEMALAAALKQFSAYVPNASAKAAFKKALVSIELFEE